MSMIYVPLWEITETRRGHGGKEDSMKIFMTGGSGFVGTTLTRELTARGHEVTILSRPIEKRHTLPDGASFLEGDPTDKGTWQEHVADHDVFINLAGASIFSKWTDEKKREIRESRILTTGNLVDAMAARQGKETHLLSTSAVGYYGYHGDEFLDESSLAGTDFLATLAADWEAAARGAEQFGVRVVLCRFGVVLGKRGGALEKMSSAFKYWMGSPLGSGKQWVSWIHEQDLARIFLFLLDHKDLKGPVNCTAPEPVRNKEMTEILGRTLEKPTFLPPVTPFFIKMILGEFGDVLLKGQRVIPDMLLRNGYEFLFPTMEAALKDLFRK
jgi:uncharacterized protein (TIGR01777 family)